MKIELKPDLLEFLKKLKNPALNVLFIFLAWVFTFILSIIAKLIFGDDSDDLMNYNPIINGFIHSSPSHLLYNLGLGFVCFIPQVNQHYNFTKIFFITLIISLAYFPISLVVGLPAIGVSGTMYFMMTRIFLNKKNKILYSIFAIIIGYEIANYTVISDGIAHNVHIIGAVLGFISLKISTYTGKFHKIASIIS